jgi:hypothetical protein
VLFFLFDCSNFNPGLRSAVLLDLVKGCKYPIPIIVSEGLDHLEVHVGGVDPIGRRELVRGRGKFTKAVKVVTTFDLRKDERDACKMAGDLQRQLRVQARQLGDQRLQMGAAIECHGMCNTPRKHEGPGWIETGPGVSNITC